MPTSAQRQPLVLRYLDENSNVRTSVVKSSKWGSSDCGCDNSDDNGSHEETQSEDSLERLSVSEEELEDDQEAFYPNEPEQLQTYSHYHPYAQDYADRDYEPQLHSETESNEDFQQSLPAPKSPKKVKTSEINQKRIYMYKNPPTYVQLKPMNVQIKSKPIYAQPSSFVDPQPRTKSALPVIKYQPYNIELGPKLEKKTKRKPKTTTVITTTTKKPSRKAHKKSCSRCSSKPRKLGEFVINYHKGQFNEGILIWNTSRHCRVHLSKLFCSSKK